MDDIDSNSNSNSNIQCFPIYLCMYVLISVISDGIVWIEENKRPVVRVTGSHKHSCLFGAIDMEGKQLFRQVG